MSIHDNKTYEEKVALYNAAVDAYEAGESIMSDEEYDCLVRELNCENEAVIGSETKSSTYTSKHSVIMGSLDKVHMEEDRTTGERNWEEVLKRINMHLSKAKRGLKRIQMTPKFDGCSFSFEAKAVERGGGFTYKVTTRGDGFFGVPIDCQFINSNFDEDFANVEDVIYDMYKFQHNGIYYDTLMIRGEALMDFDTYQRIWSKKFKNLRVAVSGALNKEYDDTDEEYKLLYDDISYVCYDYRLVDSYSGDYREIDWLCPENEDAELIKLLSKCGLKPASEWCKIYEVQNESEPLSMKNLVDAYNFFEKLRDTFKYPIDGIVVKPDAAARQTNKDRVRPLDSIAIKFITRNMSSIIKNIEWSVGRTGECYPVAIIEPVYQDGKEITRASLHGYSYLLINKVGIGSKVNIVMNGDIIPGVESVESEGELVMPDFETYVSYIGNNNVPHLMKKFTDDELTRHQFVNSADALGIDGIKSKTAGAIYDDIHSHWNGSLDNILYLLTDEGYNAIESYMKAGKSRDNIIASLKKYRSHIELDDIIRSFCFSGIGHRHSKTISDYMYGRNGVTADNLTTFQITTPFLDNEGQECKKIFEAVSLLGFDMTSPDQPDEPVESPVSAKKVILTGDPSKCTDYRTKKEWLNAHPQYVETTKWTECDILFTNDVESNSGKMAKAKKNNVEIRLYEN